MPMPLCPWLGLPLSQPLGHAVIHRPWVFARGPGVLGLAPSPLAGLGGGLVFPPLLLLLLVWLLLVLPSSGGVCQCVCDIDIGA